MAAFRGWIKGQRGQASRLGNKNSGLTANLASWQGSVTVSLWTTDAGVDMARVELTPHTNGAGSYRVLYDGPVSGNFPITLIGDPGHAEAQRETVKRFTRGEA